MSKRDLIEAIMQRNRTAAPEFLARFAEGDLKAYLDRIAVILPAHTSGSHYDRPQSEQKVLLV